MARERLPMRTIREVLRLRWQLGRSVRETARGAGVSTGVVSKLTSRAKHVGLTWAKAEAMTEAALEERIYGRRVPLTSARPEPDPVWMDTELRRPGVTLELLHIEYLAAHPNGLRYTAFCDRYRRWKKRRALSMRQHHQAGEKMFVDYSGKRPSIVDRETGERTPVELFVAALGASSYTYAEATLTQRVPDWIAAHTHALDYFGGAPKVVVPDQLRSAVATPDRYEPGIQRTYLEWSRHYDVCVVPARPYKPRDKAKVEVAVQVAQRWILARLRDETFFSLAALNERIRELLVELNSRPMKHRGGLCRGELFERLDRPALQALPETDFEPCEWRTAKVSRDHHIAIADHWYSVPHALVGERVEVRLTPRLVEVLYRGQRVASHARSDVRFQATTVAAHRPPAHRAWAELDPGGLLSWAGDVGPHTKALMERLLDAGHNFHREVRWRSGQGLRRIGDRYGAARTEEACRRALRFGGHSYKTVARILKHGLDLEALPEDVPQDDAPIEHEHVRGPDYYQ